MIHAATRRLRAVRATVCGAVRATVRATVFGAGLVPVLAIAAGGPLAAAAPLAAQQAVRTAAGTSAGDTTVAETAAPEQDGAAPVEGRARDIQQLFRSDPGGYESVFAPSFLQQVPGTTLDGIFTEYHAEHGRATALEVIGPFVGGVTVVRLTFEDGTAALMQLAVEPTKPHRVIGALIGPSFTFEAETAQAGAAQGSGAQVTIREPSYATDDYTTRTRLRLPFDGEWWVFWGGRTQETNYHRASALQRYAYDLVVRRDGSTHAGDGTRNADYWCEGRPILAPAAGVVATAKDGVPENVPGEMNSREKLGNHVVIDHGNGEFSLLAHLQTGSVAVRPGDDVAAGERIGACGNSGNSTEPHLHYQLQDGPDFFESEALPAPFHDYAADGVRVDVGEPVRGQTIEPLSAPAPEPDDSP